MRILVAHFVSPARTGGMSRLIGATHDRLRLEGHSVTYLTADDVPPRWRSRWGRLGFQFFVRRAAAAAARGGQPFDIINVHEPHGAVVASRRSGLGGASVVAMTHGLERRGWGVALAHPPSRPRVKTRILHPVTTLLPASLALRRADHVICLNSDDQAFLTRELGVPESRVTRVIPGADPVFGKAAPARTYASARRVLFAGTWLPRKGTEELVCAFTDLVQRGRDLHLDVLGAGVPKPAVLAAFGRAAAGRVHVWTGRSDAEIAAVMAEADIFVLPSLFEGTPLTLIEAMWSGLPIVTTATAGMKDVVDHERTGLLIRPADSQALAAAIERLIDDAPLRRALGAAAHHVARRNYTWESATATFASAYRAARQAHG